MFYNKVLASLLARPWSVATCLRLLTLSAGDEHTYGHQQNPQAVDPYFHDQRGAIVLEGPSMAVEGAGQSDPCNMAALRNSVRYLTTGECRN